MEKANSNFNRYLLRWSFEYRDGTKKFGIWQSPGPKEDLTCKAWCHNKNVAYAVIERKDILNPVTRDIVRCPAHEFVNFQWLATRKHNFSSGAGRSQLVGLSMTTTLVTVDCYIDGTIRHDKARNENTNFATFGK